jgi:hypothetical protein
MHAAPVAQPHSGSPLASRALSPQLRAELLDEAKAALRCQAEAAIRARLAARLRDEVAAELATDSSVRSEAVRLAAASLPPQERERELERLLGPRMREHLAAETRRLDAELQTRVDEAVATERAELATQRADLRAAEGRLKTRKAEIAAAAQAKADAISATRISDLEKALAKSQTHLRRAEASGRQRAADAEARVLQLEAQQSKQAEVEEGLKRDLQAARALVRNEQRARSLAEAAASRPESVSIGVQAGQGQPSRSELLQLLLARPVQSDSPLPDGPEIELAAHAWVPGAIYPLDDDAGPAVANYVVPQSRPPPPHHDLSTAAGSAYRQPQPPPAAPDPHEYRQMPARPVEAMSPPALSASPPIHQRRTPSLVASSISPPSPQPLVSSPQPPAAPFAALFAAEGLDRPPARSPSASRQQPATREEHFARDEQERRRFFESDDFPLPYGPVGDALHEVLSNLFDLWDAVETSFSHRNQVLADVAAAVAANAPRRALTLAQSESTELAATARETQQDYDLIRRREEIRSALHGASSLSRTELAQLRAEFARLSAALRPRLALFLDLHGKALLFRGWPYAAML